LICFCVLALRQHVRRRTLDERQRGSTPSLPHQRKPFIHTPISLGKYLVSPLTRRTPDSRYAASVSIRSGQGSATHDRVLRLVPLFDCSDDAARYALGQGIAWLQQHRSGDALKEFS
jgi:hypothetical protein